MLHLPIRFATVILPFAAMFCAAADMAARATAVVGRAADAWSAHGVRGPGGGWTMLGTPLRQLSSCAEPRGVAGSGDLL